MTVMFFEVYCSAVATAEGRVDELLEDSNGNEDWGPYRRELFRRLYTKEDCNDEIILELKRKAQWGFFILTILVLLFASVLCF